MANSNGRWRQFSIKGFPDYCLMIDDESLMVVVWCCRQTQMNKNGEWRKLKQSTTVTGYHLVALYNPELSRKKTYHVHEIVCLTVHGEPKLYTTDRGTTRKQEVLHGKLGKLNNHPSNLKWGTSKQNSEDQERDGTVLIGTRRHNAKLTESKVREIRRRYAAGGVSQASLGKEYDVPQGTIWCVIHRRLWRHVS